MRSRSHKFPSVAILTVLSLATACGDGDPITSDTAMPGSEDGHSLVTHGTTVGATEPDIAVAGILSIESDCMFLETQDGTRSLISWSTSHSFDRDTNTVSDSEGRTATIGNMFNGAARAPRSVNDEAISTESARKLSQCGWPSTPVLLIERIHTTDSDRPSVVTDTGVDLTWLRGELMVFLLEEKSSSGLEWTMSIDSAKEKVTVSYWPAHDTEQIEFTEFEASVERFVDSRLAEFGTNLGSTYSQVQRVEPIRPAG